MITCGLSFLIYLRPLHEIAISSYPASFHSKATVIIHVREICFYFKCHKNSQMVANSQAMYLSKTNISVNQRN